MSRTATQTHVRRDGSTYTTVWTKTDHFCVECGKQAVWENDCDDYYMGTDFCCAKCGAGFRHPSGPAASDDFKFLKEIK